MMLYHLQSLLNSFRYAFRGLLLCLKTQRNLRLELAAALWVMAAALALELSGGELAALLLCCGLVLSLELMNTAMEFTVDLCCPKPHPLAKAAKDAAAGGVLMAAVTAAAVGIVLFGRPDRLGALFRLSFASPLRVILLAGAAALSALFIFLPCSRQRTEHKDTEDYKGEPL